MHMAELFRHITLNVIDQILEDVLGKSREWTKEHFLFFKRLHYYHIFLKEFRNNIFRNFPQFVIFLH